MLPSVPLGNVIAALVCLAVAYLLSACGGAADGRGNSRVGMSLFCAGYFIGLGAAFLLGGVSPADLWPWPSGSAAAKPPAPMVGNQADRPPEVRAVTSTRGFERD